MIYLATTYCYNESQFQSMLTRKKGCKGRYIELRKKREADDALWQNANCLFFVHYL